MIFCERLRFLFLSHDNDTSHARSVCVTSGVLSNFHFIRRAPYALKTTPEEQTHTAVEHIIIYYITQRCLAIFFAYSNTHTQYILQTTVRGHNKQNRKINKSRNFGCSSAGTRTARSQTSRREIYDTVYINFSHTAVGADKNVRKTNGTDLLLGVGSYVCIKTALSIIIQLYITRTRYTILFLSRLLLVSTVHILCASESQYPRVFRQYFLTATLPDNRELKIERAETIRLDVLDLCIRST